MSADQISKPLSYWQEFFKNANEESWPTDTCSVARDIFERDESVIAAAAKQHNYKVYQRTRSVVSYMRQQ